MLATFLATLGVVITMLLYAMPGFALVKAKLIKEDSIPAFARLLMYVCTPCLVFDTVTRNKFSTELAIELFIAAAFIAFMLLLGLVVFFFIFKKKNEDVKYRIYNLATTFANCSFMGVPVLEALYPDFPKAVAFSAMFSLSMTIIGWSFGSYIISHEKKYMSIKKIVLNPATLGLMVAIPFFVTGFQLPSMIMNGVVLLSKMSTPLCMLIIGMRLGCVSLKGVFTVPSQYLIVFIKQIIFPLLTLAILLPLPLSTELKSAIYIMMACPVASVVLNLSEMIGQGQKNAANLVLLGTVLSVITMPLVSLLIVLF